MHFISYFGHPPIFSRPQAIDTAVRHSIASSHQSIDRRHGPRIGSICKKVRTVQADDMSAETLAFCRNE